MKYRSLCLTLFLFLNLQMVFAQKEANVWYFGSHYGLDFNASPPAILKDSKLYSPEGSGTIADTSGKLLFYSQGEFVYNSKHKLMENGFGLNGQLSNSSTCAAVIVRLPLSYRYYFIFSSDQVNGVTTGYPDNGTNYSVIDMQGDSGRGKVILKKQLLVNNSSEKIAAVVHSNKKDVWIVIKQNYSDTLFLYLLTEKGLSAKIIKHILYKDSISVGQIKFSPNGKYLALANNSRLTKNNGLYIYDFNNKSGHITNGRIIKTNTFSIEFSPNSKLIYWTSGKIINNKLHNRLYQSKIKQITTLSLSDSLFYFRDILTSGDLQLAPDKKIYYSTVDSFLTFIDFPNGLNINCNVREKGLKLFSAENIYTSRGIPSFVASHFQTPTFIISNRCINVPTNFLLLDSLDNDSVKWNFGDTASQQKNTSTKITNLSHTYKTYGDYKVSLVTFYDNRSDTTTEIVSFKNPTPNFSASDVCDKDSVRYFNKSSSSIGPLSYSWNFGDGEFSNFQSPSHLYVTGGASKTFNVTLKVKQENGCTDSITKSINVNANPDSDFSYTIIQNMVDFKATQSGNTHYKWFFGNGDSSSFNDISYLYSKSGNYTACLKVTNAANCFSKTCKDISIPVGVSKIIKPIGFKIYPNPTNQNFTIEINNPQNDLSIIIFDAFGKLIKNMETKPLDNSYIVDLNVSNGLYWVKVTNGERIYTQKIVVNQ